MPGPMTSFPEVEAKWHARWKESHAYEPKVEEGREKFLATYPYSYMNAHAHVGHAYTMLRNDMQVRYQRMLGKNVLFPFAFHVTGTPIVAAANRIRDREPKQMKIMEDLGIPASEVPRFEDPEEWVRYFPKHWRADVERLGLGIDWRREFITTSLNPHYDAFIQWQFRKLRESGYVEKGSHPVVWCPKDKAPVADHDRSEGEGETPQEWTVVKAKVVGDVPAGFAGEGSGDIILACATLRPDTMFGQTNVWVDPDYTYHVIRVGDERWVVNEGAVLKLHHQLGAEDTGVTVTGADLVGVRVQAPARDAVIPILPARFIRHERGTGIVTSVPSDSPMDYVALEDLRQGRFGTADAHALAKAIDVIPIIRTEEHGDVAARKLVTELGIREQTDSAKIQEATEEVYKAGFYSGTLLDGCGPFAGRKVAEAKEEMRAWMIAEGHADTMFETTGPVKCRCLTPAIVKLVKDQWFMKYSDPEWKKTVHAAFDRMNIHPELSRKQFHYVVDWLRDWACARETGLGTRLPWDERWVIESLSDSTIYMAYYTLAPHLEQGSVTGDASWNREGVDAGDLDDAHFDHVLLGRGDPAAIAKGTVTEEKLRTMRTEFSYWYPVDFRNSGKDLVQNHLTFFVFQHAAIWPDEPEKWPRGIGVNGWVMVDGEKMSKSQGNFVLLRQALDDYGTTVTRLVLANSGEGVDDANFDREFAPVADRRLRNLLELVENPPATRTDAAPVDAWFRSALHRHIATCGSEMAAATYKSALKTAFFDLTRDWQWYLRRAAGVPHKDVLAEYVDVQHRLLAPFIPEFAEEVHEKLGGTGLVIDAPYPAASADAINPAAEAAEDYVRTVLEDTREILKVTRKEQPTRIIYYVAPEWKATMYRWALDQVLDTGRVQMGDLMGRAKGDDLVKRHMKDAPKLAQDLVKTLSNLSKEDAEARAAAFDEADALTKSVAFFAEEFGGADVAVHMAGEPGIPDPAGKAKHATPRRPAIFVE